MNIPLVSLKKRSFLTTLILFAGIIFAGLVFAHIETPDGQNDYLHEHLNALNIQTDLNWPTIEFDISEEHKVKILKIIKKSERSSSAAEMKSILDGQALKEVEAQICLPGVESCNFPIRMGRQFLTDDLNRDMRVINVRETSRRVDLDILAKPAGLDVKGFTDETRILSFYQTQTGWIQNRIESVRSDPLIFSARENLFQDIFAEKFVGINYYPASASWADFWKEFPKDEIQKDLETANDLNVNSLRIFLTHDYFDMENTRENALMKLEVFLDICEAKGLSVLITLFDLRPNYTLSNWNADISHIDRILSRIAGHKAILGIDLKNQPDLDFEIWGQERVEAWLTIMARHVQTQYSHLPVTTGWSKSDNATGLSDVFDFVTYHEYKNPKGLEARYRKVKATAGNKPIMITELGSTIWHPPFIKALEENKQAARLDQQLNQLGDANGVFLWTLNDFDDVSPNVVGRLPWRRAQQKHFGIIRHDGTERPAATILKSFGERSQPLLEKSTLKSNPIQQTPL